MCQGSNPCGPSHSTSAIRTRSSAPTLSSGSRSHGWTSRTRSRSMRATTATGFASDSSPRFSASFHNICSHVEESIMTTSRPSPHFLSLPTALAVAAACVGTLVAAQQLAAPEPDPAALERQAEINKRPDSPGTGAFPAMKEEVAALPRHVVYRPKDLSALGGTKLGVVAWENGGCSDDGASSRFHLLEIASHGYLVIASGRILSGPGAPPREPRPAAQSGAIPPARTQASDLTEAIDWALAENQRRGSPYFGRIDPSLVAYSGWSCGGLQALAVAKDPRVKTLVLHNTGVFNEGQSISGLDVRKDVLQTLHTPAIYILGGPTDIAYANGMDDFNRIAHVPVAVANLPVGHGGTFNQPNGGAAASVAVSWLDWQLRGDTRSAKRFVGEDCGLCQDSQWSLQRKQFSAARGSR